MSNFIIVSVLVIYICICCKPSSQAIWLLTTTQHEWVVWLIHICINAIRKKMHRLHWLITFSHIIWHNVTDDSHTNVCVFFFFFKIPTIWVNVVKNLSANLLAVIFYGHFTPFAVWWAITNVDSCVSNATEHGGKQLGKQQKKKFCSVAAGLVWTKSHSGAAS